MKRKLLKYKGLLERLAKKIFYQTVPRHTHYRPTGTYLTSYSYYQMHNPAGADYQEIFPDIVTFLRVTREFYEKLSSYKLYDDTTPEDKYTLTVKTNYSLVKIPHGRIFTDNMTVVAVITHNNKLLRDVSFQYDARKTGPPPTNRVFRHSYFTKPVKFPGTVFTALTGGGGVHNYGHWLIDVLPCLYLLKESGWFETIDWFLVPNIEHDYQRDSLKMLGIDLNKVINGSLYTHIEADAIIASTAPRGERSFIIPAWITQLHRKYFVTEQVLDKKTYPELVYISRKDSLLRRIVNEDEVEAILREYGFEIVVSSQLSFIEKINLFNKARIIVSASSAGLGSLFFAAEKAKVLEIFSQGFVHTHYYNIAQSVGMDYHFLVCEHSSPAKTDLQGERENIMVDLNQLRQALNRMFAVNRDVPSADKHLSANIPGAGAEE
jgi:hypothetical protein